MSDQLHPNFPYGKGMWIWTLSQCEGGDISKIIDKCKKYDISHVIVKCGDGRNTWAQFTKELVDKFHAGGIKIYSWSYVYGIDPSTRQEIQLREGDIACWALDMGVDGHIFDAESEYEKLPDPAAFATQMLLRVREHAPNAFLAHAPFPIIDYHTKFPYVEFGKYCDAVMPQMYWGTMKRTPDNVIMWTYQQWDKWQKTWRDSGHGDSVKPIIPIGQTYDNAQTAFVCTPTDIKAFIDGTRGYMSVNFWSWQHTIRLDLWDALRDNKVDPKPQVTTNGEVTPTSPQETPQVETSQPAQGGPEEPAAPVQQPTTPVAEVEVPATTEPEVIVVPIEVPVTEPNPVTPEEKKQEPELPAKIEVPKDGKATIELRDDPNAPNGVEVKVRFHRTHLDMVINMLKAILKVLGVTSL